MRKVAQLIVLAVLVLVTAAVVTTAPALAQGNVGGTAVARLRSFEEVPAAFTPGGGRFEATIDDAGTEVEYTLNYSNIEGTVTQAHLHFAQRSVNGGITVFLCSNLGNGPAGTQACPASGTIHGTITSGDVLAVAAQSALAGDLPSLLRGIRAGVVYANVHTDQLPGGSIRGQLLFTPNDGSRPQSEEEEASE